VSPEIPELRERLSDGEVELRTSSEWDIPDILIAHQDDRELYRRLGLTRPPSGAELGRAAERDPAERATGTGVKLTIVEPGSDDCRGRVEVHEIDWERGSAELAIWVAPQLRGRETARRALRLAAGWLFASVGLRRLTLNVEADNVAMLRAASAAGFERQSDGQTIALVLESGGSSGA
jgi:RimJ/RimL family protein N-acetyltransferase